MSHNTVIDQLEETFKQDVQTRKDFVQRLKDGRDDKSLTEPEAQLLTRVKLLETQLGGLIKAVKEGTIDLNATVQDRQYDGFDILLSQYGVDPLKGEDDDDHDSDIDPDPPETE